VVVNRHWAALFGRGLVPTVDDFGFQGQPPSHPELLDWLAVEFQARDVSVRRDADRETALPGESSAPQTSSQTVHSWDLKRLHRLIVTSATYRQASYVTSELLERDPENVWLARSARLRLEAELVRDAALAASGLLVPKMGGPPVRPPQPEGVTETAYGKPKWDASTGPDRYRRSLYTFLKRTAPFAMYAVFDAPSGEACTARRDVSNTPLQALTLLNDVVFLEAAQTLGRELASRDGSDEERVREAMYRVLTRRPDDEELARLTAFVAAQRERFSQADVDPTVLAGRGTDNPAEHAAWTALARALLSVDEAIVRE
jgi:hypothetical protein